MLQKGNAWYVRHYEAYFDRVYVAYVFGSPHQPVASGTTTLVSLGTGRGTKIDLALAPYRLYQFARRIKPTHYISHDIVYSWWVCKLVKALLGAKVFLMPVCIPEEIYAITGRSMSGFLPIWLEREFIFYSFSSADKVLTALNFERMARYLSSISSIRKKLIIIDVLPDPLPSKGFFEKLETADKKIERNDFVLVHVGRLHREKMVEDLIAMMASLRGLNVKLNLIGDGPEKTRLEGLASELDVKRMVNFVGSVSNEDLPDHLLAADVYVSPYTASALREAALCGLPIIAYDMGGGHAQLEHEKNALLVPCRDHKEMARQVVRLMRDRELRGRLSRNAKELAWRIWSPLALGESVRKAFKDS
jgi:glycosyltransferase involved in cell wall biosynthesis